MTKEKLKIQRDIGCCTNQIMRNEKLRTKKALKRQIMEKIKEYKTKQIESRLADIEKMKNDSSRLVKIL